jgi:hypothetical protein
MKRCAALFCLVIFASFAVADPFAGDGGGSSSSSDNSSISVILTVAVVAGVCTLFLTDIISDNAHDSPNAITETIEEPLNDETGVNWEQLNTGSISESESVPLVAVSVFPGVNGRNLAIYFSSLIEQGNNIYYRIYSSPVSFGQMNSAEAASTGFSFLGCQWFIATGNNGLELFQKNTTDPLWVFDTAEWDSSTVRNAASSFILFSRIE